MSGYTTKTVMYNDPWDCGKQDSEKEPYELQYYGSSDTVEFRRSGRTIVGLSKGDAWLLCKAFEDFLAVNEWRLFQEPNPFMQE